MELLQIIGWGSLSILVIMIGYDRLKTKYRNNKQIENERLKMFARVKQERSETTKEKIKLTEGQNRDMLFFQYK